MLGASGNARKAGNVGFSLEALALLAIISASGLNHAETRESKDFLKSKFCFGRHTGFDTYPA